MAALYRVDNLITKGIGWAATDDPSLGWGGLYTNPNKAWSYFLVVGRVHPANIGTLIDGPHTWNGQPCPGDAGMSPVEPSDQMKAMGPVAVPSPTAIYPIANFPVPGTPLPEGMYEYIGNIGSGFTWSFGDGSWGSRGPDRDWAWRMRTLNSHNTVPSHTTITGTIYEIQGPLPLQGGERLSSAPQLTFVHSAPVVMEVLKKPKPSPYLPRMRESKPYSPEAFLTGNARMQSRVEQIALGKRMGREDAAAGIEPRLVQLPEWVAIGYRQGYSEREKCGP